MRCSCGCWLSSSCNPYLAALWATPQPPGRPTPFLGERYRRIARCRDAKKANMASIWHLLPDPARALTTPDPTSTPSVSTLSAASATTPASRSTLIQDHPSARRLTSRA